MFRGSSALSLIYAVDFSTLTSTVGGKFAAAPQTIDGKEWNAENFGNADTFQVTNGSGLIIDPSVAASNLAVSTRTAPIVSIKFGSISSRLIKVPTPQIFVIASFTHSNLDADTEQGRLMYERYLGGSGTPTNAVQQTAWIGRTFATSAKFECGTIRNNVVSSFTDTSSTTDDVMAYYTRNAGTVIDLFTGVTSGGALPAFGALTQRGTVTLNGPSAISGADDFALSLTAFPVNTNNAFSWTWKKLAVYAAF